MLQYAYEQLPLHTRSGLSVSQYHIPLLQSSTVVVSHYINEFIARKYDDLYWVEVIISDRERLRSVRVVTEMRKKRVFVSQVHGHCA